MSDYTLAPVTGFSSQQRLLPPAAPAWLQSEKRLQREDTTTSTDYLGSMWRQDGLIDGLIAHYVGKQMAPDPNYTPFDEAEWKELTEGVWPEFQKELAKATSAGQARYIKDRLLQKQNDLVRLGDLGLGGNIARLALGVLSPENLALGYAGGVVSRGLRMAQLARAGRAAESSVGQAVARAGALAEVAASASRPSAVAGGVATGALGNAAYEALRQSVNFEDDSTAVLEAALIGAAFTTPFAFAGARAEARVAKAAQEEHAALKVLAKVDEGKPLTVEEAKVLDQVVKSHETIRDIEAGRITPEEAFERIYGKELQGPRMPDDVWLARFEDNLRRRGEAILDELFPRRVTERTKRVFLGDKEQPLLLGYDPNASGKPTMMVGANGQAFPTMGLKDLEENLQKLATRRYPKDAAKAERWVMKMRTELLGLSNPERALRIEEAKLDKAAQKRPAPMEVIAGETKQAPDEAPTVPQQTPEASPMPDVVEHKRPSDEPQLAPEASQKVPAGPTIGKVYDFRTRTGEVKWGELTAIRDDGWWILKDEDDKVFPVHPSRIVNNQEAPTGFLAGSVGAAQVNAINDVVRESTAMRKLRLDYFSILDRSESQKVRDLAFELIKDPIQSNEAQRMTASEWKAHLKRTIGGIFHVQARAAAREAADALKIPLWARASFYHEFHSMVTRLTRGDVSVLQVNPQMAPMLRKASAAQKEVYRKMLEEAKAVGVKGVEDVDFNEFYVNRVWNHRSIREAIDKHGAEAVHRLLADAIKVEGYSGDVKKAASFLTAVQRLEFSKVMQNVHLYAQDMGTLRQLLAQEGLEQDQIDALVDMLFTAKERDGSDKGRAANLKYRFDLDETLSADLPTGTLRVSDLLENDARVLVDSYLETMGGHVAMAKKGFRSEAEFAAALREIENEAIEKGLRGVQKDVKYLQDIYAHIVGRPMSTQDFSGTARAASALRGYTRSVMLGQLGLTAAFEMKQAVGLMGFRAFYTQLPTFREFIDGLRNGYIPSRELAMDVMQMTGFGTEMSAGYARAQEIDDGFLGQSLTRLEHWANMASHAVDIVSGNASFTSLTRQLSGMMAIQRVFDFANGRVHGKFMENFRERAVGWGIDKAHLDGLLESLKRYTKANKGGRVEAIEWERWLQEDPQHYEQFQTLLSRMVRDAIQDQDLGEMMPFMHQTLGKLFGELKTFFFVAHAKNMLKNLHYRDATAFQVWSISFIGEMMAYSLQTSLNYAHDPDKRDELLTPEAIATAAFVRSPVNGLVPFFAETTYQVATGGRSLIGPDMTANTGNRSLLITPSMVALGNLWAAPSTATGLILDQGTVTRSEGLSLWKTLPLSNMIGARNLGAILSSSLPERELASD